MASPDPLQPPVGGRDATRHYQTLYDPLVGDRDVTRHHQTLYNPRWETVT